MEPWPAGLPCVRVRQVSAVLDFYLAAGCEVHIAADGWVVLRIGAVQFVVASAAAGRSVSGSVVRLATDDN